MPPAARKAWAFASSQPSWVKRRPGGSRQPLADVLALDDGAGVGRLRDVAFEVDFDGRRPWRSPGLDLDHDHRCAARPRLAPDRDAGIEIAQGAEQFARVALGQDDQARQFGVVQVAHRAVAPQFQVALQQAAAPVRGARMSDG